MIARMVPKVGRDNTPLKTAVWPHGRHTDFDHLSSVSREDYRRKRHRSYGESCDSENRKIFRMVVWFIVVTVLPAVLGVVAAMAYPRWLN
ncbi:hypothetical protein KOR42_42950 [Thalassoglobus neptunius]|uniref:Uncharacterized protein n=1 Tax=Thalassoglobus neptunius TaxID=1938619 RepID=A0A5C5WAC5_9PLAN|nr:hypothetical protein [Thalassoglobus neptunius]TWT46951.1 hypothetical protein KOR42_42950 [Thalassoglobus neptunius]